VKVVRGLFLCSSFCETAVNHLHVSSFLLINRRKRRDPGLMTDFLPFNESVIVSPGSSSTLSFFIQKKERTRRRPQPTVMWSVGWASRPLKGLLSLLTKRRERRG
jgi:hypothetical protein